MQHLSCYKLTLVTQKNHTPLAVYLSFLEQCVGAGVTSIQLREKNLSPSELWEFAQALKLLTQRLSVTLIINDHLNLAFQINADGVHLGQTDGDPIQARQLLGPNKLIGVSINSYAQLHYANTLPIDYIGVGTIFSTKNKPNIQTQWGTENLKQVVTQSTHPIIAIGGINLTNVAKVMHTGVAGIAAIGAFHDTATPAIITTQLRQIIDKGTQQ